MSNEPSPPPPPDPERKTLLQRALLPELMFVPDVALALRIKFSAACKAIRRGDCGPYIRFGRRLAVRRESFVEALCAREVTPPAPTLNRNLGKPRREMLSLLNRKNRPALEGEKP